MLGRLIIALLVICSAAGVAWQRQQSETVAIAANIEGNKAQDADARAAAAEKRASEAAVRAAQAEAKAAYYEAQIAEKKRAEEAALEEELSLHIVDVTYAGVAHDVARFELKLEGPAAAITRVRVYNDATAYDTMSGNLAVTFKGKRVDGGLTTRDGATTLTLGCGLEASPFAPGMSYALEITRGDGHVMSRTVTIHKR